MTKSGKIKEQELRLNELQIKQFEKEEAKEKMAEMKANIIHSPDFVTQKCPFCN